MFLRAERAGQLDEVEDELFRFARIVDGSPELSVLLDDPAADPDSRASLVERVLGGRVDPLTVELLTGLARHPGGRSYSHGIRELVEQAAQRTGQGGRHRAVGGRADVQTSSTGCPRALRRIYGRKVAVHVVVEPALLGGIRIQVGDEVIDGSVAGRLETLRSTLAG